MKRRRRDRVRGPLHLIAFDCGGNEGIAWIVAERDWPAFYRWMEVWT